MTLTIIDEAAVKAAKQELLDAVREHGYAPLSTTYQRAHQAMEDAAQAVIDAHLNPDSHVSCNKVSDLSVLPPVCRAAVKLRRLLGIDKAPEPTVTIADMTPGRIYQAGGSAPLFVLGVQEDGKAFHCIPLNGVRSFLTIKVGLYGNAWERIDEERLNDAKRAELERIREVICSL